VSDEGRLWDAVDARLSGASWRVVAEQFGFVDADAARVAVTAETSRMAGPRNDQRAIDLARLDKVVESLWWSAAQGEPESVALLLRTIDMRLSVLRGMMQDSDEGSTRGKASSTPLDEVAARRSARRANA